MVSRGDAVRHALDSLRVEGRISSRQGTRSVVLPRPRAQAFAELQSFTAWARGLGAVPGARVIAHREVADRVEVIRVRLLDAEPVLLERSLYPLAIGRLLAGADLERGSIYELLAAAGHVVAFAEHQIEAIAAGADDAELLERSVGTPLLRLTRRAFAADGSELEQADDRYCGDAVSFTVRNETRASHLSRAVGRKR